MLRVGGGALQLSQSPGVVGHVLGVLRVDGVDLALRGALREKRLRFQEEIKKNQIPFRKQRNPIDDSYPNRHFFYLSSKSGVSNNSSRLEYWLASYVHPFIQLVQVSSFAEFSPWIALEMGHFLRYLEEKLSEAVERLRQLLRHDVEVVVGVVRAGVGVAAAAVLAEELGVLVLQRVLLRAQEEHVLAKVRQTGQLLRIAHVPWNADHSLPFSKVIVDQICKSQGLYNICFTC